MRTPRTGPAEALRIALAASLALGACPSLASAQALLAPPAGPETAAVPDAAAALADGLGVDVPAARFGEVRAAVSAELRNEPSLPLETALARALTAVHALPSPKAERLAARLTGRPEEVLSSSRFGEVRAASWFDGSLNAVTEHGLVRIGPEGPSRTVQKDGISDAAKIGGRLYLATDDGLLVKDEKGWSRALGDKGKVRAVLDWKGRPLVETDRGTYLKVGPIWWGGFVPHYFGGVRRVLELEGKRYLAAWNGLFEDRRRGWRKAFDQGVGDAVEFDGTVFAASKVLMRRVEGGWERADWKANDVEALGVIGGKLYFGGSEGLREYESDLSSRKVLPEPVLRIVPDGAGAYVVGPRRVLRWEPGNGVDPTQLIDSKAIEAAAVSEPSPASGLSSDEGRVVKAGRTVFSAIARLATPRGLGFGEPAEPSASIWPELAEKLSRELELPSDRLNPERWKDETVRLLRNDPSRPLADAMADAAAQVADMDAATRKAVEDVLTGKPIAVMGQPISFAAQAGGRQLVQSGDALYELRDGRLEPFKDLTSPLRDAVEFRGAVYLGGQELTRLEGRSFRTIPRRADPLNQLVADGEAIYAATEKKVYRSADGLTFTPFFAPKHGTVSRIALSGGHLFVATTEGFYSNETGTFELDLQGLSMRDVLVVGDRLFAAARHGVYSRPLAGGALKPIDPGLGSNSRRLFSAGGTLFLSTQDGVVPLLEKVGEEFEPLVEPFGRVHFVQNAGGKTYVGGANGLFVRQGKDWRPAEGFPHAAKALLVDGDRVYVAGGGGLARLTRFPPPGDWQAAALRELEGVAVSVSPSPSGDPLAADGTSIAKNGRTIFSALGRLASRVGLGFGEPPAGSSAEEPAAPKPSPWVAVHRRLSAEFGLPEDDADVPAFKAAVIEELRNKPGARLELVFLDAFARSRPGKAETAERLRALATGVPQRVPSDWGRIHSLRLIDGRLHAATDNGLYALSGSGWKPLLEGREVLDAGRVGGILYAAVDEGVLAFEDGWKLSLKARGPYNISSLGGRPLVSAQAGQYLWKWGAWSRSLPGIGFVHRIVELGGRGYASTADGLLEERWWGWKNILSNDRQLIGSVRDVAVFEGRLYAATEWGVLRRDGRRWTHILHDKEMNSLAVVGGRLAVGSLDGLRVLEGGAWRKVLGRPVHDILPTEGGAYFRTHDAVFEWRPSLRFAAASELPELLSDLGKALAASARPSEPPKEEPLSDSSSGVEKRGRTIFSGLTAGLERELRLPRGSIPPDAFEKAARRLLRDRPGAPLEEIALDAARKAGAPGERVESLRRELAGELRMSLSGAGAVEAVRWIDGRAWAATEQGLFVLVDGAWRKAGGVPGAQDIAKVGGRWYMASKHGLDVLASPGDPSPDSVWKPQLGGGPAYRVLELGGRPLVERVSEFNVRETKLKQLGLWSEFHPGFESIKRTFESRGETYVVAKALYRRGRLGWRKVRLPGAPYVNDAAQAGGTIFVAASNGLWKLAEGRPPELLSESSKRSLAIAGDRLVAGDQDGLFVWEPSGWRSIYSKPFLHIDQIEPAGEGQWLLRSIWGAYLWRPKRSLLDPAESAELTEALSLDPGAPASAPEPLSSDGESVLKGSRSILGSR